MSEKTMDESDRDVEMREEYDFREATRGPVVPPDPGKTRITIRLDTDVLDWFRAQVHAQGGGNYQTLINRALRDYIAGQTRASEGPHVDTPMPREVRQVIDALIRQQAEHVEALKRLEPPPVEALLRGYTEQMEATLRRIIREEVPSGR